MKPGSGRFDPRFPPPHPGEVLREDVLPSVGLSRVRLAQHLGVSRRVLTDVLNERRPINLDLARRLGAALGSGAHYWLGLQVQHDLWQARIAEPVAVKPIHFTARRRAPAEGLPLA